MASFLFAILVSLASTSAFADITSISYTGASQVDVSTVNHKVFAGTAGDRTTCVGSSTCNSCQQTIGAGASPTACNENRILGTGYLSVNFISTKTGYGVIKSTSSTSSFSFSTNSSFTAGQTVSVSALWSRVCEAANGSATADTANCEIDKSTSITFGIDETNDGTLEESKTFQVYIQRNVADTALDANDCTSGSTPNDCLGLHSFTIKRGDQKVFLRDFTKNDSTTFPTNGVVQFSKIRLYYRQGVTACAGGANSIRNVSPYFETSLEKNGDNYEPGSDRFDGLVNDSYYGFKIALVDQAGNIGYFTPDSYCGCTSSFCTTGADRLGTHGNHFAKPSEVAGLLASDKNCFIATAAFGSPFERHVQDFREFRNQFLLKSSLGQKFVRWYYRNSPPLAQAIEGSETLKFLSRILLWPLWVGAWLSLHIHLNILILLFAILPIIPFVILLRKKVTE